MIRNVKHALQRLLKQLGYELRRANPKQMSHSPMPPVLPQGSKVYVGCGDDRKEGYIGCDIRKLPSVDIVCRAWELSSHISRASEIYSRHMLEHLTLAEVECTLLDWFEALDIGGMIHIVVPNLDFHIRQWTRAVWSQDTYREMKSDARYAFAGFYGWQRECDPRLPNYNASYWDVHKSGYNKSNLEFLMKWAGYSSITLEVVDEVHLVGTAVKILNKKERQVTPFLEEIRADHRGRYLLAQDHMVHGNILDIACGIGYGTQMLARFSPESCITGVDIHAGAIAYARQWYSAPNASYIEGDALLLNCDTRYDTIVSFETLEHIEEHKKFLVNLHRILKDNGVLILSTPNQDRMPFSSKAFPYHVRHFRPEELALLLRDVGFEVMHWYSQHDTNSVEVQSERDGKFLVVVARKRR